MIYSIEELKRRIAPVAEKYGLQEVYLFGSYARSEATEQSDVDILIDRTGSKIRGIFEMGRLYEDLCIGKEVDLVTTQTLEQSGSACRCSSRTYRRRNCLAHSYSEADEKILWETACNDTPQGPGILRA